MTKVKTVTRPPSRKAILEECERLTQRVNTLSDLCSEIRKTHDDAIGREKDWRDASYRSRDALKAAQSQLDSYRRERDFAVGQLERTLGWVNAKLDRHPLDDRTFFERGPALGQG